MQRTLRTFVAPSLAVMSILLIQLHATHGATFYNNLTAENGGVEAAAGNRWLAGIFKTDAAAYNSLTATLLMAQSAAGTAQLDLYSNDALRPNTLLGTFTSPVNYSTTTANTLFTLTGVALAANTNYWLVLHAPSGSFDWAWTSDFLVMNDWGDSPDAGGIWYSGTSSPFQYKVASGVLAGDYNHDNIVNAADYTVWRNSLGQTGQHLAADGDNDGSIDADDWGVWQSHFGTVGAGSGSLATGTSVPEPTSVAAAMMALAAALALFRPRRRRRLL